MGVCRRLRLSSAVVAKVGRVLPRCALSEGYGLTAARLLVYSADARQERAYKASALRGGGRTETSYSMPVPSSEHPSSFTAWAFTERSETLTRLTVPWKDPAEGQLVIKVLACGVCGTYVSPSSIEPA